jgi:hypothetical protein
MRRQEVDCGKDRRSHPEQHHDDRHYARYNDWHDGVDEYR